MQEVDYKLIVDKDIKELSKYEECLNNFLSELNNYKDLIKESINEYNQFRSSKEKEIEDYLASLDKEIEEYNEKHSLEKEENKVMNNRNLVFRLKKGQIDKVLKEANDNVSSLEKECFEKINGFEDEIKRLEKEFNLQVYEAEKKAKNDVKRINDSILCPKIKDENETIDLVTVSEKELMDKFNKDEEKIYELRIEGISEIAKIKKEFYELKHQLELEYIAKRVELKRNIELTKSKEDEEVANLRHIIKEESGRLRDEDYFTNHNAMINLIGVHYKNALSISKIKANGYKKVKDLYQELDVVDNKTIEYNYSVNDLQKKYSLDVLNMFSVDLVDAINNLSSDIESFKDSFNSFIDAKGKSLDDLSKYLLLDKESIKCDYNEILNHIDDLINSYKDDRSLIEGIDNQDINNKIIENKIKKENNSFNELIKELERNLNNLFSLNKNYLDNESGFLNSQINNDIIAHEEWYKVKCSEIENEKAIAKKTYLDDCADLENEKNDYAKTYTSYYVNEINKFKVNMAKIIKQPKVINDKYNKLLDSEIKRIENEYSFNINRVLKEEAESKMMCKKN